jgi:hypothetical protein
MTVHSNPHPLAGQTVRLRAGVTDPIREMVTGGAQFRLEDWFDRLVGKSWANAAGNPAAFQYGLRVFHIGHIRLDDEVVYGKIGNLGHLVHNSEIQAPVCVPQ